MPDPCLLDGDTISLDMTTDTPPRLTAEVIQSQDSENGLVQLSDGLWAPRQPIIVGSLPGSPQDGWERYLSALDPAGPHAYTLWHCRYIGATGRWAFLGGPSYSEFGAAEDTFSSGGSYGWVGGGGVPSLGIAATGKYDVEFGASGRSWDPAEVLDVGLSVNNDTPSDDRIMSFGGGGTSPDGDFLFSSVTNFRSLILQNGDLLTFHYRASGNSGSNVNRVRRKWMRVTPVYFGS